MLLHGKPFCPGECTQCGPHHKDRVLFVRRDGGAGEPGLLSEIEPGIYEVLYIEYGVGE